MRQKDLSICTPFSTDPADSKGEHVREEITLSQWQEMMWGRKPDQAQQICKKEAKFEEQERRKDQVQAVGREQHDGSANVELIWT